MRPASYLIGFGVAFIGLCGLAHAEIKDYEVLRFLYLKTPCGIGSVERIESKASGLRYRARCPNQTAFPDGVIVACLDPEDDRSCRLETRATEFKQLDLMRPPEPGTTSPGKEN